MGNTRSDKPTDAALDARASELSPAKRALFERMLAEKRAKASSGATGAIPRRADSSRAPLSVQQRPIWLLEQMSPGLTNYNVSIARRINGAVDTQALQRALDAVVVRHEALRTTFAEENGEAVQVIGAPQPVRLHVIDLGSGQDTSAEAVVAERVRQPFLLDRDLLLRATVIIEDTERWVLLLESHHIVMDGWSVGILFRELGALYDAERGVGSAELRPLSITYGDYAVWQQGQLSGDAHASLLDFWKHTLDGAPPLLELATDRPRKSTIDYAGETRHVMLSAESTTALRALGQAHDATLYMTLLAAYQALLRRYTGQDEAVVGTVVAGRARPELEDVIGFLANALPVRVSSAGQPTFVEMIARARAALLGAYAHDMVPVETIILETKSDIPAGTTPLFQTALVLQNAAEGIDAFGHSTAAPLRSRHGVAQFDITVSVSEAAGGLRISAEFRTGLFDATSVERLLGHLRTLIERAVASPHSCVDELTLLSDEEREQIVVDWNDTAIPVSLTTLHSLIATHVVTTPDAVALRFAGETLTYAELDARANRVAHALRARGVGPNVVVGLSVERSFDFPVGVLGILKAGGAWLPLDPAYPVDRLTFMLEDSGASVLLTQRALCERIAWPTPTLAFEDIPEGGVTDAVDDGSGPDDLAYVIYTSGSTGKPKGALLRHRNAVNLAAALGRVLDLTGPQRVLQFSALSFDASVIEILWSLGHGGSLHLISQEQVTSPELLTQFVVAEQVEATLLAPVMLRALDPSAVPSLQTVISGGEACGADIVDRWAPGRRLFNFYGPTEITVAATAHHCAAGEGAPPIGRPLANYQTYILDTRSEPVPIGVPGELWVGGAGVGAGYLNRPDLTAQRFVPDPFSTDPDARLYRTGDRARWRANGVIDYLGRADDQVKLRGFRIELGEIEALLSQQPGLEATAAVVREDTPGDQRLVAYYVAAPGTEVSQAALLAPLRAGLPQFMVPSALVPLDAMPLLPSGKVNRKALPAPTSLLPDADFVEPRNDVEAMVASVWSEVLGRDRIGATSNFFELGGHSLLATRIVARVAKMFRCQLALHRFFDAPTVAGNASAIEDALTPPRALAVARAILKLKHLSPDEREQLRRATAESTTMRQV